MVQLVSRILLYLEKAFGLDWITLLFGFAGSNEDEMTKREPNKTLTS